MRANREIRSLAKSFKNAFRGIKSVMKYGRNFRIHICMMIYVLIFSIIGEVGSAEISRFVLCFGIMFSAELVNTALELLCDTVARGYDERIRDIKDIAAGAVLVCAIASAVVGLAVFLSPDVFWRIMSRLWELPLLTAALVLSLPLAVWFIIKRGK